MRETQIGSFSILTLLVIAIIPGATAQEGRNQSAAVNDAAMQEGEAPGVTVTDAGNRVVYGPAFFNQYNVITAGDILDRIPGIQGLLGGGGGGRGFGNGGDQVLINGKRLSGKSNDIGSTLGRVQARQVLRVEVIRGTVDDLDVRSQGRVVNVVLNENLVTSYGSWEGSWTRYSDGRSVPGAEVNYSGDVGSLNYVMSVEAGPWRGRDEGTDLFYTPDGSLFERQEEVDVGENDRYSFTANTTYTLDNGDILNLNGLYGTEDRTQNEISERFQVDGADEVFLRDLRVSGNDARSNWEVGGDYEHVFGNGNILTGLFVVTANKGDGETRFDFTNAGEARGVDEVRIESQESAEKILRGTYRWGITDTGSFESGAEVAVNTLDRGIRQFEDENGDGTLEETSLFNQASEVKENRVEAFTTYTWQAGEDLLVEGSLDLEASELTQGGGDVSRSREFFFAKPRLVVRYDLNQRVQLRGRIQRRVNQLNFGAFTASFTNDDNRLDVISAGNPELVPEKSWDYELTYEQRLPEDAGIVSVTGSYRDVEDKQANIPLLVQDEDGEPQERTAPGNIGDGRSMSLSVDASLRLGWLGLNRAVVDGSVEYRDTSVTDPFTGTEREFNWFSSWEWDLGFRHDTNWKNFSYGLETGNQAPNKRFDRDYLQTGQQDIDLEVFMEMQPWENFTVRLEVEELLRAESQRERFQFAGNRGEAALERRELRYSRPLREITLSVQGVF